MNTLKRIILISLLIPFLTACGNNSNNQNTINEDIKAEETALDVVKIFVESLGKKDFETAYNLQQNTKWNDYEKFSSTKSFGGINATSINEIRKEDDENGKSVIYVDAYYYDPVNGDNQFKQKFYLQEIDNQWKIVDLKIVEIVGSNKSKNNEFENFLALFINCNLPYPDNFNSQDTKISEEYVKKYITANEELEMDSYGDGVIAQGKFKIDNKYYGVIFRFRNFDGQGLNTYLFIFKNDGTYKSNLQIGYDFQNAGFGHHYETEIDTEYNIKMTLTETYRECNSCETESTTTTKNYEIKAGIIVEN